MIARMKRAGAGVAVAVAVVVVGVGVAFALNPARVSAPRFGRVDNLVEDASFELPSQLSPWKVVSPGAARRSSAVAHGGAAAALLPSGVSVRQDIALSAVKERSYRATAWVRAADPGGADGELVAATRCDHGERAVTRFRAGGSWTPVSATLSPLRPEGCSLAVEIVSTGKAALLFDEVTFSDPLLRDPSFGQPNAPVWRFGEAGSLAAEPVDGGSNSGSGSGSNSGSGAAPAPDGDTYVRVSARTAGASLSQDYALDPSSEAVFATAELQARSAGAATVPVRLALWNLCTGRDPAVLEADLHRGWQTLRVRLGPVIDLIRPTAGCKLRVELYLDTAGAPVDVDAAVLELDPIPRRFPVKG